MVAQKGVEVQLYLGAKWGWVVNVTPRPLYSREKDPVPIVHEDGWVPGPVWTGAENLAPTGIRFPDRPTRSRDLRMCVWKFQVTTYLTVLILYVASGQRGSFSGL